MKLGDLEDFELLNEFLSIDLSLKESIRVGGKCF